jgi:nitroreductase
MRTARTIRRYDDRPVDDALLLRCLEAATWAPSGGNQQPWRFVVLRSPDSRRLLHEGAQSTAATISRRYGLRRPDPGDTSPRARNDRALFELLDHAADVPVAVLFCVQEQAEVPLLVQGASIYPAMQNFLLAARAEGLGTAVTGWQVPVEDRLRALVGVPGDWHLAALVVAGWPLGRHGPLRRRPVASVTSLDRWDEPLPG